MPLRLSLKPAVLAAGVVVAAAGIAACTNALGRYESDFPVVIENRSANAIQVLVNGADLGAVATGQTGSFTVHAQETNGNVFVNGVAPTPQAEVVFSAKDQKTGNISAAKTVTLSQTPPTYVTFSANDFPTVARTVANFNSSPTNPGINQDVFFNASSSTGSNNTYAWSFGDGTTGTGVQVTHQYTQVGTFTVTLTATSDNGQTATSQRTVAVSANLSPQAATFTYSPRAPAVNQDVNFSVTAAVTGTTFTWDFGDGSAGLGANPTHRYTRASTYTVVLRVSNNLGQSATSSQTVPVSGALTGTVNFTFSPTTPGINDSVSFNASSSTVGNASYAWDFGDGSSGTGITTTHRYTRASTYTVSLTATNDVGQTATTSKTVTVSGTSTSLVADFTISPTTPGVGDDVFFNSSPSIGASTFSWNFGDGTTGTGSLVSHKFTRAATYTVTLTVTSSTGQTATGSHTVTVSAGTLTADFTISPTSAAAGDDISFNASPSVVTGGTFSWSFGDGATGTGILVTHQFSRAATFTVTLTVTSSAGLTATTSKTVTVTAAPALTADFTFSPTDPSRSRGTNTVNFDATPSSASATAWTWDFGDGGTSSGKTAGHTYSQGTWVVRLTISDGAGRTATTTKNVTVAQ